MSEMLPVDVIESTFSSQLRDGFASECGRHKEQGDLLDRLMEELQSLRSFPTRAGVLGNHNVVGLKAKAFRTLCQVQDEIGVYCEFCFLELLQAGIDSVCIAMNEKDAKGTASVRSRRVLRTETPQIRLGFVLR